MIWKKAFAGLQSVENTGKFGYVPVFFLINRENA
tara:strand:- start:209 stop:310 length:102 start_codon:yes stop_codon:yes gene_type:complete